MKRIVIAAILMLAVIFTATPAKAEGVGSVFGNLMTAQALGQGKGDFTAGVGIADATSFFGQFNYGLSQYMNGRLKVGLADPGEGADTKLVLGADLMWQIWDYTGAPENKHPFDMALGGMFEWADYEFISVIELGGFALGSYPIVMQNGSVLTPYGRFGIRWENVDFDFPGAESNSDLEFGINGGLEWEITDATSLFGEFQFDGNDGVFFGVNFNGM